MTIDKGKAGEIDCLEAIDNLYAYLDGEIEDPAVIEEFETHVSHCRSCYSRAEMEKALNGRIAREREGDVPESLRTRLRGLIERL